MLNENKNIDQLFHDKLGEFEKTPPLSVWTNIQGRLNANRKERRIVVLKTMGVAAAIILAFLSGWWMTNLADKGTVVPQNRVAEQRVIKSNVDSSTNKSTETAEIISVNKDQIASNTSGFSKNVNRKSSTKLSSLATFAANTSFICNDSRSTSKKSGELELFSTEKEFLDGIPQNFKVVKKLADWITKISSDSVNTTTSNSKSINIDPFKHITSDESVAIAFNSPVKNKAGRWSLKAEFAPVFNNQSAITGQSSNLYSSVSPNYKQQETTAENTISGGMVAGYKVGKRIIVKSGFVYNNIRQTTRNVDFAGVNPLYKVAGNTSLAMTPAGQVNMNNTVSANSSAVFSPSPILNSDYQFNNPTNYTVKNDLRQDIKYIEIPVQVTYKLIDRKINIGLTGGISTNILVGNKAILTENGESISSGETANMRSMVYSGAVGLEIGYEITKRITLTVEPRLKHYVSSLSANKSVDFKPSQLGIVTGLTYSFN